MPQVILTSDEHGWEEFDYDTLRESKAAFARLKKSCQIETDTDGIERRLILALETWMSE